MGCLFSLLELKYFQSDYIKIPEDIYNKNNQIKEKKKLFQVSFFIF